MRGKLQKKVGLKSPVYLIVLQSTQRWKRAIIAIPKALICTSIDYSLIT